MKIFIKELKYNPPQIFHSEDIKYYYSTVDGNDDEDLYYTITIILLTGKHFSYSFSNEQKLNNILKQLKLRNVKEM